MKKGIKSLVSILVGVSLSNIIFAQNAESISASSIYDNGGNFSHAIAGLFAVMVVLFIVKAYRIIIKEKIDSKGFYLKLKNYIKNDQLKQALNVCENFKNTTIGFIFWNGLMAYNDAKNSDLKGAELQRAVQNGFDEAGLQKIPEIDSGLFWFDIISQVATLLGLLGTIYGLMLSFQSMGDKTLAETEKQDKLINGIYKAMGTTAMGLIVAIPTMFAKGWLQGKAEKIIDSIDEYSIKAINQINQKIAE